jgi:hypothetical protein
MGLPAEDAERSVLSRVAWRDATSDACVMEPALQHPRPVVSDQPKLKPAVQPHWSEYEVRGWLPARMRSGLC